MICTFLQLHFAFFEREDRCGLPLYPRSDLIGCIEQIFTAWPPGSERQLLFFVELCNENPACPEASNHRRECFSHQPGFQMKKDHTTCIVFSGPHQRRFELRHLIIDRHTPFGSKPECFLTSRFAPVDGINVPPLLCGKDGVAPLAFSRK